MTEKMVFFLYYHQGLNIFMDIDGHVVLDIFSLIKPQDLFLFRHDMGQNIFPMRSMKNALVEIMVVPDEACGGPLDYPEPLFDLGDDLERIDRYYDLRLFARVWV